MKWFATTCCQPSWKATRLATTCCQTLEGPTCKLRHASAFRTDASFSFANQPAPYRGLSGPSGPKCRKSLENVSRALRPQNPEKSPKSLGSPESLLKVSKESFQTVPESFWRLLGVPGARGPGRHFRDFSSVSGPKGPRDLCRGRAGSQCFIYN